MLRLSFYGEESLSKDRLSFLATEFARFGLTVHLGIKEPNRVTSKTEAMHIAVGSMPTDPSATEDYGDGDNGNFISFCDSFRRLVSQSRPTLRRTLALALELELVQGISYFMPMQCNLRQKD
jgi:hypothetical protein